MDVLQTVNEWMCYRQTANFNEWMCYLVESIYVFNIGSKLKEGGGGGGY